MAEASSIDALYQLLNKGKTTSTSGGTVTEQKVMGTDTVTALIKQALESNGGLSTLLSGQASAGLYNSSTNKMLVDDLVARVGTNVAAQAAPTVRTSSPQTTVVKNQSLTGKDYAGLLMGMVGKGYGDKFLKSKNPFGSLKDWFSEAVSSGGGSGGGVSAPLTDTQITDAITSAAATNNASIEAATQLGESAFSEPAPMQASETSGIGNSTADLMDMNSGASATPNYSTGDGNSIADAMDMNAGASAKPEYNTSSSSSSSSGNYLSALTGAMGGYAVGDYNSKTDPDMSSGEDGFGTYHKDRRAEVGGATLGAFLGYEGGAIGSSIAPAVVNWFHPYAQDMTRDVINFGDDAGGVTGAMLLDPAGASFSGKYSDNELLAAPLGAPAGPLADKVTEEASSFIDKNCFITTAVCQQLGKSDTCEELVAMRKLRDEYALTSGYKHEVDEYYEKAPKIVEAIRSNPSSSRIFSDFYNLYIVPAVAAVHLGQYEKAHTIYRNLFNHALEISGV